MIPFLNEKTISSGETIGFHIHVRYQMRRQCCLRTLILVYFAKFKLPAYQLEHEAAYITTTWIVKRLKLELYGELNGFKGNKRYYGVTSLVNTL